MKTVITYRHVWCPFSTTPYDNVLADWYENRFLSLRESLCLISISNSFSFITIWTVYQLLLDTT